MLKKEGCHLQFARNELQFVDLNLLINSEIHFYFHFQSISFLLQSGFSYWVCNWEYHSIFL